MHPRVRELLVNELAIDESEIYELPTPLDLRGLDIIADIPREDLHFGKAVPIVSRDLAEAESSDQPDVFGALREREILVQHPYESFSTSVQAFIEQAAQDPHVVAIKQSLYRTSGDSPIVDALIEAAQAGKQVLAVVEIKARFDEANNITWARKLERAGVHVVYGIVGLKTHAKLCLVVRHEAGGLRRYCHVGTGNYHPKTARGYEDMGLLTADPHVGEDIAKLFNQLSGLAPGTTYSRLLVAPARVRDGLLEHIDEATRRARAGERARIRIKVNSIVDETDHRPSLPRVPRRGERPAVRPGDLRDPSRHHGAQREHPGAVDPGPVPRALAGIRLRVRRGLRAHGGVHRVRGPHAPQSGPSRRGTRAPAGPATHR